MAMAVRGLRCDYEGCAATEWRLGLQGERGRWGYQPPSATTIQKPGMPHFDPIMPEDKPDMPAIVVG